MTAVVELLERAASLRDPDLEPIIEWRGGEDGRAWPVYEPMVQQFFEWAHTSPLIDLDYDPDLAGQIIADLDALARADLATLRQVLTWCVRGERFNPGHWGIVIASGRFEALMNRFEERTWAAQ